MASYWWRDSARMRFFVRVKNLTGVTLSDWENSTDGARITYENASC